MRTLKSVHCSFPFGLPYSLLIFGNPALYGKPYIAAAKDTWRLFMDRGIDALINDSLVGMSEYCCPFAFLRGVLTLMRQRLLGGPISLAFFRPCSRISTFAVSPTIRHVRLSLLKAWSLVTHPLYNSDGQYTAPVLLFAFLIGLQCCQFLF